MTVQFTKNSTDAGSIHVERSEVLPAFLQFDGDPFLKGWSVLRNVRSTLEAETAKAGWISFFMAGKIEKSSFGFNRQKTLGAAMRRLATRVKSENCNSFEIMHVTSRKFLGVLRVTVAAHARHLQEARGSSVCFGQ
ncbi:MAG TPA: hypothetical protein VK789_33585 [Bryobacteraceae bacterium]|nr:hypothetical protein [Bryobacteraceae bacterium]